ncbi:DNA primase [Candidatus Woesearchaeota archaeon]|nr:DNA primase [Candidatus Woesearchaeota archaeon]
MGKISPVSAKYIIQTTINIDGVVDRPDVIGAIFGQTEGLLGADLELRELQRSGRIGRIEVNTDTRSGKTSGTIIIPSSLDKAETSIIAAALEIIQRIGPCTAKMKVDRIEDVRVTKRAFVVERAKELLKQLMDTMMPDSQEIADEVMYSVRAMEIRPYGKDRLPAGPFIDESDEIIVVEGRADVLNLIKHGIKNAIAMNGTSVPETIIDLSRKKDVTVFVDGDRGGDLILKEILGVADVDYVTKAPDGKEVEEITKKEIHKAIRSRVSAEQARFEIFPRQEALRQERELKQEVRHEPREMRRETRQEIKPFAQKMQQIQVQPQQPPVLAVQQVQPPRRAGTSITQDERRAFREMSEDLIGTRGAYILDKGLNILGKVPITELLPTISELDSAYAIIFDGLIEKEIVDAAEKANVQFIVAMDAKQKPETKINLLTVNEL